MGLLVVKVFDADSCIVLISHSVLKASREEACFDDQLNMQIDPSSFALCSLLHCCTVIRVGFLEHILTYLRVFWLLYHMFRVFILWRVHQLL